MIWCWFNLSNANFIQYAFLYSTSNIYDLSSLHFAAAARHIWRTLANEWFIRLGCLSTANCAGSNFGEKFHFLEDPLLWGLLDDSSTLINIFLSPCNDLTWFIAGFAALQAALKTQFDCQYAQFTFHEMPFHFEVLTSLQQSRPSACQKINLLMIIRAVG